MSSLLDDIHKSSIKVPLPNECDKRTISLAAVATISKTHEIPGHIVEAEALKQGICPTRYLRNMNSITVAQQIKLLESSIAQIGLGGLGGNLLEMFLRTGIGCIRAADGDHFEESNLNRQALSTPQNLTRPKSDAADARATQINPSIEIETLNEFLSPQSLPDFVVDCDVVVDALGGLKTRLALQEAASAADIPLVTGALAGWTGYVSVVLPGLSGPAEFMGQDNAAEKILGCPSPAVTFIASLMATETIKLLSGSPSSIAGKILIIDLQSLSFETIIL